MSRSARRFGAIGAVLGTAVFLWPARSGLIGDPTYEVHNHLWYFAHALVGIQGNFPAGWDLPLMDPPNLPWFALGWLVSPAAAWNTMCAPLMASSICAQLRTSPMMKLKSGRC